MVAAVTANTNATNATTEVPFWRVELSTEQRTFVAVVVVIAVLVAVGTLIFACVWCLLDQDGLCPPGWCNCLGTPKETFSPQRWWMEALAQRVENLEAAQPLMERTGRRKRVSRVCLFLSVSRITQKLDCSDKLLLDGCGV